MDAGIESAIRTGALGPAAPGSHEIQMIAAVARADERAPPSIPGGRPVAAGVACDAPDFFLHVFVERLRGAAGDVDERCRTPVENGRRAIHQEMVRIQPPA